MYTLVKATHTQTLSHLSLRLYHAPVCHLSLPTLPPLALLASCLRYLMREILYPGWMTVGVLRCVRVKTMSTKSPAEGTGWIFLKLYTTMAAGWYLYKRRGGAKEGFDILLYLCVRRLLACVVWWRGLEEEKEGTGASTTSRSRSRSACV